MYSPNTLLVDSVHLEFPGRTVLQSAYITSTTGRVTGLLGRNGCGKSSLFKCIMGAVKAQNIFVRLGDERDTDHDHIGQWVKYLPQYSLIPQYMTLGEAFSLYGVDYDGLVTFDTKFHPFQRKAPSQLSGGEVRIAETYLILNSDAQFCILDEPFSFIAPNCVEKIKAMIREKKKTKGIIISDHMYEDIIDVTDDLFVMRDGYTFPVKSREDLIQNGYILR